MTVREITSGRAGRIKAIRSALAECEAALTFARSAVGRLEKLRDALKREAVKLNPVGGPD